MNTVDDERPRTRGKEWGRAQNAETMDDGAFFLLLLYLIFASKLQFVEFKNKKRSKHDYYFIFSYCRVSSRRRLTLHNAYLPVNVSFTRR